MALKYKFHSLDFVKDEITYLGSRKIPYVFGADSNFAMHNRDREIAEHMVATKRKYNAPEKFRVCFGKNTDDKIFEVAKILHEADLEKGITLARQSNDPVTLKNIRRDNIKMSTYRNLQARFNDAGVPVYSELILGLPGETKESWKKGVDDLITGGLRASLFIYCCQILPNTEMADPAYIEKHGIKTRRIELQEIHGSPRQLGWTTEYEDIVVETATMPHADWREMCKFSWMTMLLHSMKAGFFVMGWLWDRFKVPPSEFIACLLEKSRPYSYLRAEIANWEHLLDRMERGEGRGQILEAFGNIYFDVEEASLLRLSKHWSKFRDEVEASVSVLVAESKEVVHYFDGELSSVMAYQQLRMPSVTVPYAPGYSYAFDYNVPEYFDRLFSSSPVPLERKPQTLTLHPKDFGGDKERFAKETVLWGRKSGTMLVPCEWKDA